MEKNTEKIVPSSTRESGHIDCECILVEAWDKNLRESQIPSCLKRKVDLFFQDTVESGLSHLKMVWDIKNTNAVFLNALKRGTSLLRMIEAQLGVVT